MKAWIKPLIAIAVIALIAAGGSGYMYYKYVQAQKTIANLKGDPNTLQNAATEQAKLLVAEVGKLISLPEGDPTVATITDIEKLKDQEFFKNAKNGDKVLIYTQAKKAILYDPVAKKIIDVAPVNIGNSTPSAQIAGAQAPTVKVALYNGTSAIGLTNTVQADLESKVTDVEVVIRTNAAKKDYEKTMVVVIDESKKAEAEALAKVFNVEVSSLPEGETKPNAEILVILGQDQVK